MGLMRYHLMQTALLISLCLVLTGCVTSKKYKMAKEDTPPVRPLIWQVSTGSAELLLQTVIIFKGPGSWKREARWDEYVVQVSNLGEEKLTVHTAELIDIQDMAQVPGNDPWQLEKLSYSNWDKYGKSGLKVLAGAGAVVLYGATASTLAISSIMAGGATTGAMTVLNVIPVIAIVDITAVAIMNSRNKKAVVAEFDRRRLPLPATIAPGSSLQGSWFFPMTPGPKRLIVRGTKGPRGDELVTMEMDLKPFAGLHLKPVK